MAKFLDNTGLAYFWGKIKAWCNNTFAAISHSHAWSAITGKPTTISGYGITDAKIVSGTITLGSNTITPLTSHQSLANYVTLNSAQTISAVKTFTAKPVLNQVGLDMTVKDTNADTLRTYQVLHANSDNTGYGINVAFGGSGNTVVGAGESHTAQLNNLAGNASENLYLVADNNIYFRVNGNTWSNVKTITLDTTAHLYGLAKVTATSFIGSLTGDVTGNCSGTSTNVTGTVAIANGGTGSTTRVNAVKSLLNENVGTSAQFFLTCANNWANDGYTSVADAKTVLGLGTAAYTASTAYAAASHSHSYLPLGGGTVTGTITSNKSGPNIVLKHPNYAKNDAVGSWTYFETLDKNNARTAWIGHSSSTDKSVHCGFYLRKQTTNDEVNLAVHYNASGVAYATAPTPPSNATDTEITTAAWVNGKGYLTSHQSLANYVTLNGTQTITGTKTFSASSIIINEGGTWSNGPSSNVYRSIAFKQNDGYSDGDILFYFNSSANGGSRGISLRPAITTLLNAYYKDTSEFAVTVQCDLYASSTFDLGRSSKKWGKVYATTGTIQTSDKRLKEDIISIPDSVLDVWENISWKQFKLKESIKEKGKDSARIHSGIIAQDIQELFVNANIDCNKYGFFCYDEWDAEEAQYDDNGNILMPALEADNQYSIRYEEALCIEAAYQRRKNKILENRISELENQLASVLEILQSLKGVN